MSPAAVGSWIEEWAVGNVAATPVLTFTVSPSVQISNLTRGGNTSFYVGDSFQVSVQGPPNQQVSNTAEQNANGWSTTPYGYTDSNGNFSMSGVMTLAAVGSWTEVWTVGSYQALPTLSFTVTPVTYTIGGQVKLGAAGLAGVTVGLSGYSTASVRPTPSLTGGPGSPSDGWPPRPQA
ncbi:MAG: hypothetical protein ACLQIS_18025 [Bryobacteraceae bacterium]